MKKRQDEPLESTEAGIVGIGWATTGGEAKALFNERYIAADGIENCIEVLEQIDNSDLTGIDFIELNACAGGCVGGAMTVGNPYVTQSKLQSLKQYLPVSPNRPASPWIPDQFFNKKTIEYQPYSALSDDKAEAMRMMGDIEAVMETLPKLDCGSCGAPTCMAFAEDIVKGETSADECTVNMRMLFHRYLEQRKEKSYLDRLNPLAKPQAEEDEK